MKRKINFHKQEITPFKIREENIEQIEMSNNAIAMLPIANDVQKGYEDPRWIEKSNSIKARDNYTCQLCHAFNPMQGDFVFIQQGEYETCHQYSAGNSSYKIHVRKYDFTVNFDFYAGYHLAMPRLNVHHKVYYRYRDLWDYKDDCLVTLCEKCHHYVHSLNDIGIPIVEENPDGRIILIGKTRPKSNQYKLDHTDLGTFQPLALVRENNWGNGLKGHDLADFKRAKNENKQWYDYHKILDDNVVHIDYFKCYDPRWNKYTPEEIKKVAEFIIQDFIENILGFSKIKQ